MSEAPARRLAIVGGGTAGWMTAATCAHFMRRGWAITLVESDAIGSIGVGEATIPQIRLFNAALGIDEAEMLRACQGSFKLGIAFEGWRAPDHRYMHGFGGVGRDLGLLPFYHYWVRASTGEDSRAGLPVGKAREDSLDAYSVAAQAAYAGRFAPPDPARPAPAGGHNYAYHFDATLYAAFLRARAEAGGVTRVEGRITHVERDGVSGDILALVLEDGTRVGGDLFIDCSGMAGLLIERECNAGFEDWGQWLPCDTALAVPSRAGLPAGKAGEEGRAGGPILPYTRSIARAAGWQWQIPLQHRIGNGHVYSSRHMSDDEAAAILLANLPGEALAEPRLIRFAAGRRRKIWSHNVIAIGLSSGFLEPLESTSIHLIQTGIERLLQRLPNTHPGEAERAAYNDDARAEMERIRDFIILHYFANGRDEPFWQERRETPIPDSLAERIALFRACGRIDRHGNELFTGLAWQQVLIGQGVVPQGAHPLTEQISAGDLSGFIETTRRVVSHSAAAMPIHADYIAQHCAAGVPS
ncbi:MAG: tryptophan halogenase family protein [Sphingopyxis sp.]